MRSPVEAFAAYYVAMPDEELLRVAANRHSLVPVAQAALRAELTKREAKGLVVPEVQKPKSDPGPWWWPKISDVDSAQKAARNGAAAAYFVAAVRGILAIISIFRPTGIITGYSLFDAALFASLGFFIQRKLSRVAAVAALVMFVAERLYTAIEQHRVSAGIGVVSVVLLLAFISGARGALAYQRYSKGSLPATSLG